MEVSNGKTAPSLRKFVLLVGTTWKKSRMRTRFCASINGQFQRTGMSEIPMPATTFCPDFLSPRVPRLICFRNMFDVYLVARCFG